ncbi:unnamed protein product [Closterium sp. NIES-53]
MASQDGSQEAPKLTICVGDIHGHYVRLVNLWKRLEAKAGDDFATCTVIFLGDFNDRGPRTKDVIEWLVGLPERYPQQKHVFLAGNHDFSFASFIGALPRFQPPSGFKFSETWRGAEKDEEREGWWKGDDMENVHLQGRRWAGTIKDRISKKGKPYDGSTYDAGATFRSYGAEFGNREALIAAVPESHKEFLRNLSWIYEQPGVDTGDAATSYSRLIAVHAGFDKDRPLGEQIEELRRRQPVASRYEALSGRKNVWDNPEELEKDNVLVVSGHHGVLDTSRRLRLIIDEAGGLDAPIAAMMLPSREIIRDTDPLPGSEDVVAQMTEVVEAAALTQEESARELEPVAA